MPHVFLDLMPQNASQLSNLSTEIFTVVHTGPEKLYEVQNYKALVLFEHFFVIFEQYDHNLSCIIDVQHTIDIRDQPPILMRSVFQYQASEEIVAEKLDKLLKAGIIVPSKSLWTSLVLSIRKNDEIDWVVIDYCQFNKLS